MKLLMLVDKRLSPDGFVTQYYKSGCEYDIPSMLACSLCADGMAKRIERKNMPQKLATSRYADSSQ